MDEGRGAFGLTLTEERRVRVARLARAMRGRDPAPPLTQAPFHLYAEERLYATRPTERLERFGGAPVPDCYQDFGPTVFPDVAAGGVMTYHPPALETVPARISPAWRRQGGGLLHLTNWRVAFQGETGDWLDFPFEAITWSGCFWDGIALSAANWSPMYFRTAYPEWLYAYYRFLAHRVLPEVQVTPELERRARAGGY